jgi:hypothetical protein
MQVFADFHHAGLQHSLKILFEDRLKGELYRPIGLDWFNNGYFKIAEPYGNAMDTVNQFLGINGGTWDMYKNLNADYKLEDGVYYIYDGQYKYHHKAITLDTFKEMQIDIVIASIPAHITPFRELITKYHPSAKFIFQMGNMFSDINYSQIPNLMASTIPFLNPCHSVFYHQEFDLDVFKYVPPVEGKKIKSFVHCLPKKEVYDMYKSELPEFEFKAHGASCPDETYSDMKDIARLMQESTFGYHWKTGDGFGHTIHSWGAVGRPVLVSYNYYKDSLAGKFLIPDKNCIDISEGTNFMETIKKVRYFSQPEIHTQMCENMIKAFRNAVNFDDEFITIKSFLENLV